jgi:hypothetical protein
MQEILYPEFCAALVRVAEVRFSNIKGVNERLRRLVMQHLLPLQQSHLSRPLQRLQGNTPFSQYLQLMDPIMKITFTAAADCVIVWLSHYIALTMPLFHVSVHDACAFIAIGTYKVAL